MNPVKLFIHFDEADPAKIVFFGNYYRLAHRAMELTLPQWGLTWDDFFRREGFGFPVRHSEADYFRPIRPGKEIFVSVSAEKITASSITFKSEFRNSEDMNSEITSVVRIVHVCIDSKSLKKANLPQDLVNRLKQN